jgi:hypothetical protein
VAPRRGARVIVKKEQKAAPRKKCRAGGADSVPENDVAHRVSDTAEEVGHRAVQQRDKLEAIFEDCVAGIGISNGRATPMTGLFPVLCAAG